MSAPLASVLLPVYNAERYLARALDSVLAQTWRDFEVLLLNDGSTDGSGAIAAAYAERDARVRVHAWPNRGLIATLNAGIELAAGRYAIRMDADDICRPHRFERQIAYLQSHPHCVAVGSRVMLIDAEGWPIREFFGEALTHNEIDAAHLGGKGGSICHPSAVMRTDALRAIGGYRAAFAHSEDYDLFLRLAEVGQLANLPEVLLEYRQHADSIGYRYARKQWDSARRAVAAACERRRLPEVEWLRESAQLDYESPTRADMHRKWAWWALMAGNRRTAGKHAWKALQYQPFDAQSLKLCACVLRGR